ncbi:FxSxx-COOH cyclophane-containing RiPP peptide [Plantactinospora sp. GCM10030261]|uniref:FxSxx-COOH cyclophane-containing RiPP peptide n=1 Tax=Plantactinospora sp. GCM10030261 TaxID=3273420 RepID=UPI0036113273
MDSIEHDIASDVLEVGDIPLGDLLALDDTVFASSVRRMLDSVALPDQESVSPFTSVI